MPESKSQGVSPFSPCLRISAAMAPLPTEKEWYPVGEFFHLPKNSKQVGEVKE
jgi:hypothetical protein